MATKEELLAKLAELKKQRAALDGNGNPDSSLNAIPSKNNKSFFGELAGGKDSILGNLGQIGSDIVEGGVNAVKGTYNLASNVVNEVASPSDPRLKQMGLIDRIGPALSNSLYQGVSNENQFVDRTRDLVLGGIPGGRTAGQLVTDYARDELRPSSDYGEMLRKDVTGFVAPAVAIAGPSLAKRGYQSARDSLLGLPENDRLALRAANKESYGNALNLEEFRSAQEQNLVDINKDYHQAFTDTNPVAGIDTANLSGREALTQFGKNLNEIKVSAVKTRNDIVSEAAQQELILANQGASTGEAIKVGKSFEDLALNKLDENGLPVGIDQILLTSGEGKPGALAALEYVKEKFGIAPAQMSPYTNLEMVPANPGRALTATELNNLRLDIDGQIKSLGGYDLNNIPPGMKPSEIPAQIKTFKYLRNELDSALKSHLNELIGPEKAEAFTKAGDSYGMATQAEFLRNRFENETGQAFAPGSAKAVPPGVGPLGTGGATDKFLNTVAPDVARARMETRALKRETNAIRQLQTLVDFNTGRLTKPAPRGLAQLKTDLASLLNVGSLAVQMGLIRAPQELSSMPDEGARQVIKMVAQAVPTAFAPSPDNINSFDGQFVTPLDKDFHVANNLNKDAKTRALAIGPAIGENKYVPTTPAVKPTVIPAYGPTLDSLNQALKTPAPMPNEQETLDYDGSSKSMLNQLEKMTRIHSSDVVH